MADTTNSIRRCRVHGAAERRASAWRCPRDMFDGAVNMPVLHQAVKAFLANQRQGNAADQDAR